MKYYIHIHRVAGICSAEVEAAFWFVLFFSQDVALCLSRCQLTYLLQ